MTCGLNLKRLNNLHKIIINNKNHHHHNCNEKKNSKNIKKFQEKQVMQMKTMAHYELIDSQSLSSSPWTAFPLTYLLSMTQHGLGYPLG